jgi:signal transduction histidine kinase
MQAEELLQRRWVRLGLYLGFWTFLGAINVSQSYSMMTSMHREFHLWPTVVIGLADWYCWAALTPAIFYVARLLPFDHRRWLYSLLLHFVLSLVCAVFIAALMVPLFQWQAREFSEEAGSGLSLFHLLFVKYLLDYLWVYWAILGVCHALDYYHKYRAREREALSLEARLAEARLQVLKMQLQPHFLFNTLHAISSLMHQDVELADRMLARLADLLRFTLENAGTQEVPLKQELEFVELYLEIEQARLGPRLAVRVEADPEAMDAYVPNLILQPLVENAIRHGIAPRRGRGHIEIRTTRDNGTVQVEVLDNGPGLTLEPHAQLREGVGLMNTRARLQHLYGDAHQFAVANRPGGGLAVTLRVPFRENPEDFPSASGEDGEQEGPGTSGF